MEFARLVRHRYSTRAYRQDPVHRNALDRCFEAARLAPSACNSQPWKFIVVDRPGIRERLAGAAFSGMFSMNAFARTAPVLVAVVVKTPVLPALLGGFARRVRFPFIDVAIACEHIVLQAVEEGIGSCWIGCFNERAVKTVLCLSRSVSVPVMLALGYPEGRCPPKVRKPLDEIRTYAG